MPDLPIDTGSRERDFLRARPKLRWLAARLLATPDDIRFVLDEARAHWLAVEGTYDAPTRYLLRVVGHLCLAAHRDHSGRRSDPPSAAPVMAIADEAQVAMLIAFTRMPANARRHFVAALLDGTTSSSSPDGTDALALARREIGLMRPCLSAMEVRGDRGQ